MSRATYLLTTEVNALNTWGGELRRVFSEDVEVYGAFLVGSSLTTSKWRDIDIRHIVSDDSWNRLVKMIDVGYFNHTMSLWGQRVTGLPVDYQLQRMGDPQNDGPKHPIDVLEGYVNGVQRTPRGEVV